MMKVLFIIAVLFLVSCNSPSAMDDKDGLIPMSKGSSWEYDYDVELNPKSTSFKITDVETSSGKTSATFDSFPCMGMWDTKTIIVRNSDGSYSMDYPEAEDVMFIPPASMIRTGYKWKSSEWNLTVAGDKEEVTVSGKTYKDCVHITFSASITFWGEMWLKEGVGIVKWQFLRTNPPTTELGHYLLKTYSIK